MEHLIYFPEVEVGTHRILVVVCRELKVLSVEMNQDRVITYEA